MSKKIWLSMHPRKFSNHVTVRAPSEPKVYIFLPTRFFHKPFKTLCVLSESRWDTRMKETTFSFSLTGSFLACECTLHLAPPILKSDWLSIVLISALIGLSDKPDLFNLEYDYRPNWTTRSSVTN